MGVLRKLDDLRESGIISYLEVEYVRYLTQLNPNEGHEVLLAAAACIHAQRNGHVCLNFNAIEQQFLFYDERSGIQFTDSLKTTWLNRLQESDLVGSGKGLSPMVLENNRLYLHKFWKYEEELSEWLKNKSEVNKDFDEPVIQVIHSVLKPGFDLFEVNWQHVAVYLSFLKDLLIISGGPGTGKTHTVRSILASHLMADENLRIALAAPTGKAARRLTESIEKGKDHLPVETLSKINKLQDAVTVHKLLGADFSGSRFKYNEQNKLPYDIIVIDEASMLDISMWVRLIRALGEKTKVILLGDKDQLASVEAGSILGDICQGENEYSQSVSEKISAAFGTTVPSVLNKPAINDCILFLKKSYRFGEDSGIYQFAEAVNNFDADKAIQILNDPDYGDITWLVPDEKVLNEVITKYAVSHYQEYSESTNESMLSASNTNKILCSVHNGPMGTNQINMDAERQIRNKLNGGKYKEWYPGRIVMADKNNRALKIKNGEIGVCIGENANHLIFEGEQLRKISTARMKEYKPAYAITIHKSQGSEFNNVVILLSGSVKTILSKEILYTSVTRARKNTLIVGTEDTIREAIKHSVMRHSGLQQKIWGKN